MMDSLGSENQELKDRLVELSFEREVDRYRAETVERLLVELATQIERSRRQIESISAEKDELLGIAAHDLRSPLTVILGAVESLQTQATEENQELIQMIMDSSESMLDLLNSTLDVEKIKNGRVSIERQRQNLLPVLEKSLKNYSLAAQSKHVGIEYEKRVDDVPVLIDAIRMEEVFNNLISNAIKYSHPETTVTVSTAISDGHIQVSVSDKGVGIRQDEVDKVFAKFAEISSEPTGGESSTGLGLAIVKKLLELHDGKISFSSAHGEGSMFTVTLPILKEAHETTPREELSPTVPSEGAEERYVATEPLKVLLIDDSQGARRVLAPMLESLGLEILGEAPDGRLGLERYKELRPDVVFLDMVMPLMSGIEVLKEIREANPRAIVVILSSITSRETILESKEAGAFAYLLKPFEIQKIRQTVNEIKQKLIKERRELI